MFRATVHRILDDRDWAEIRIEITSLVESFTTERVVPVNSTFCLDVCEAVHAQMLSITQTIARQIVTTYRHERSPVHRKRSGSPQKASNRSSVKQVKPNVLSVIDFAKKIRPSVVVGSRWNGFFALAAPFTGQRLAFVVVSVDWPDIAIRFDVDGEPAMVTADQFRRASSVRIY